MILTKDNLRLGLVLGLFGPIVGLLLIYLAKYSSTDLVDFLDSFIHSNKLITSVGALCLLANAVLFTLYINTQRDNTAKGIFLTTVIYGIGILVLKILNP
jgi:drug/metabolite transporter (DMT)-like permease